MSIYCGVFPSNPSPTKFQMEELFDTIDQEKITDKVVADFGLTEHGEKWQIGISLNSARKKFAVFYDSLSDGEKLLFQNKFFNSAVAYLLEISGNMEKAGIKVDTSKLREFHQAVGKEIATVLLK